MTQDTPNSANSPSTAAASTPTGDIVQVSTVGAVHYITLNRTEAYNSLNQELRLALIEAFRNAQKDSEELGSAVRAVVLRANGKAFCSGQDLKEQLRDTQNRTGMEKVVEEYNPMTELLAGISVPTIATATMTSRLRCSGAAIVSSQPRNAPIANTMTKYSGMSTTQSRASEARKRTPAGLVSESGCVAALLG